jgi:hypothetical protein
LGWLPDLYFLHPSRGQSQRHCSQIADDPLLVDATAIRPLYGRNGELESHPVQQKNLGANKHRDYYPEWNDNHPVNLVIV